MSNTSSALASLAMLVATLITTGVHHIFRLGPGLILPSALGVAIPVVLWVLYARTGQSELLWTYAAYAALVVFWFGFLDGFLALAAADRVALAHVDRVVLEAFTAGIARCEEGEARDLLQDVCTLYALTTIEDDLAWFMGHNRLSIPRAKEVTQLLNAQCEKLRPHTEPLVEGFGVAWGALKIPILTDYDS